jgi:hypothetical protein
LTENHEQAITAALQTENRGSANRG